MSEMTDRTFCSSFLLGLLVLLLVSGVKQSSDDSSTRVNADCHNQHLTTALHHVRACNNNVVQVSRCADALHHVRT